ncbi:iron permease FTR1 family protein [Calocera cornea HHB12733]|uniref:Iron permease FTR1 family protein n=1 Tax=Calocera cornea HHB12733 TaxID=1353952 RepID=A0A165I2F6_9BASI|nr:iron permease FTR1 family protein [Calocera cornea HHB12733]
MGAQDVFSVPIFLIILRESIEAGIIVSILLSFVKQLVLGKKGEKLPTTTATTVTAPTEENVDATGSVPAELPVPEEEVMALSDKQLYRKLVIQIWLGTGIGFGIALCIGAAFIAVFYTKLQDLWAKTEDAWEGAFSLLAAGLILAMGIAFLKLEGSSAKWRVHLSHAFRKGDGDRSGRGGKYALLLLPMITVLREGLEAIVFVGGVSLSESAKSIPLAVVVGLMCGGLVSYFIYKGGAVLAIRYFLIVSTCILFLVGAGLFSRAVGYFQTFVFNQGVGADVEELGDGPGSYNVHGAVWHLTYGNPENTQTGGGWSIFNAILGWNNTATVGTIVAYCGFWILVILILGYMKWAEGRGHVLGVKSKAYRERQVRLAERARAESASVNSDEKASVESPA